MVDSEVNERLKKIANGRGQEAVTWKKNALRTETKWYTRKVKALEPRRSKIKSCTHHITDCGALKSHLSCLSFSCPICKMELITPTL